MDRTGKNKVDIASALKVDPVTITRFLDGRNVRPIVEAAIDGLLTSASWQKQDPEEPPPKAA